MKTNFLNYVLAVLFSLLVACTDYEAALDARHEAWKTSVVSNMPSDTLNSESSSSFNLVLSSSYFFIPSSSNIALSSSSVAPKSSSGKVKLSSSVVRSSSSKKLVSSSSVIRSSSSEKVKSSSSITIEIGFVTDSRDGQTYKTVKIDSQTWMAQNLNYETDNSYCYNDSAYYCAKYGRLYTWAAAMDSAGTWNMNGKGCGYYGSTCSQTYPVRGVCPTGWHLPTKAEFVMLFTAVGGQSTAGTKLKSISDWNNSGDGTDDYSFSVLPAGSKNYDGSYNFEGDNAFFWSSIEYNSYSAYGIYLYYNYVGVSLFDNGKYYGASVRCVKD